MMIRVPAHVRAHLVRHPQQDTRTAAAALGITRKSVYGYRSLLIQEGALRSRYRRISVDDVADALTDGAPLAQIARQHRTSARALVNRMHRAGISVQAVCADQVYSGAHLLRLCGRYPNQHGFAQLRAWQDQGLRVITQQGATRITSYRITALDLMAFLECPDCPIAPERITDPDWRQYVAAARAGRLGPVVARTDTRQSSARPLCANDCGAFVSEHGRRCRSCASMGNTNAAH